MPQHAEYPKEPIEQRKSCRWMNLHMTWKRVCMSSSNMWSNPCQQIIKLPNSYWKVSIKYVRSSCSSGNSPNSRNVMHLKASFLGKQFLRVLRLPEDRNASSGGRSNRVTCAVRCHAAPWVVLRCVALRGGAVSSVNASSRRVPRIACRIQYT